MPKKTARPPAGGTFRRQQGLVSVQVYVPPPVRNALRGLAGAQGQSLQVYVRDLLEREAKRKPGKDL